jgi:transcriptional regulator with XRE-family HTH domain
MQRRRAIADGRRNQFGALLVHWRALRRESQLSLAVSASISQRHVSFLESGRAKPSRDMVVRLCETLDIPLRARNELLISAGYAPVYAQSSLAGDEMTPVREALQRIIAHHEPYPAFVLDREWNVVMINQAAQRVLTAVIGADGLADLSPGGALNFMRTMFAPNGMRGHMRNWSKTEPLLLARLRREAAGDPNSPSAKLLREFAAAPIASEPDEIAAGLTPTVPAEMMIGERPLKLFNTITTFGTPHDVTVQELRIEMSFPADAESEAMLRRLAESA